MVNAVLLDKERHLCLSSQRAHSSLEEMKPKVPHETWEEKANLKAHIQNTEACMQHFEH